jgi:hypothetical protein
METPNNLKFKAIVKGILYRKYNLPNSLLSIKCILKKETFNICKENEDGRINSCTDEIEIIKILEDKMPGRIIRPGKRMWYDILVYDYQYDWLPVNIKSTRTSTSDNTGNLAMCVWAYTDEKLDLRKKNTYKNGDMSKILIDKLKKKKYNYNNTKDYYFVVVNKVNPNDIIVNSIKGLTILSSNNNNLPFQVCWNKNRKFTYKNIIKNIEMLLNALQKPKPSWKESFLNDVRKITL